MRNNLKIVGLLGAAVTAVAACGSSDTSSSSAGSGGSTSTAQTNICQGATAKPGYTNGVATITGGANSLSGAGSTFINPLMSVWSSAYNQATNVKVAYQSIGSGGGVAQVQAKTVDFGASDAYMSDGDIAKAKGPIVQIPLTLAPVVATYNIPGIATGLKFDGETLGKLFAGEITSWNDPALQALNPGASLPNLPVAIVHRSDGSGTTFIWTDYLTKTSPAWVSALGGAKTSVGKTVAWPVGIGGKGNEGVSGAVRQTQGALGYVELGYALQQSLPYGYVKNKSGNFIEPCLQTVSAAAVGATFPSDLRFDLTNAPGPNAYPVTGTTWALVYQQQTDQAKAAALVNFISWTLTTGQDLSASVNYAPLGKDLQALCIAELKQITLNGQPLVTG